MKKIFPLMSIATFLLPFSNITPASAQRDNYRLVDSCLTTMSEGRYNEGIQHMDHIPHSEVDPGDLIVVAHYAYLNADSMRFWSILEHLTREHGFMLTEQHAGLAYHKALTDGAGASRFDSIQALCLPLFYATRSKEDIARMKDLDDIRIRDQLRGDINRALLDTTVHPRTCSLALIAYLDDRNFQELLATSRRYGFPNNFDLHYNATSTASLVLWHNCADSVNYITKWDAIWPFLNDAYDSGKINNSFVQTYDYFLAKYFGYQLYGTVQGNVEVRDKAHLSERRKRYGLE